MPWLHTKHVLCGKTAMRSLIKFTNLATKSLIKQLQNMSGKCLINSKKYLPLFSKPFYKNAICWLTSVTVYLFFFFFYQNIYIMTDKNIYIYVCVYSSDFSIYQFVPAKVIIKIFWSGQNLKCSVYNSFSLLYDKGRAANFRFRLLDGNCFI